MPFDSPSSAAEQAPLLTDLVIPRAAAWPGDDDPVVAALHDALAKIATPRQWCKFRLSMPRKWWRLWQPPRYCSLGALFATIKDHCLRQQCEMALNKAVRLRGLGPDYNELAQYNDRPATTHADIMAVWADAIAIARAAASKPPVRTV